MEIWKPVTGFPRYEVSSLGRVKSLARVEQMTWYNAVRRYKEKVLIPAVKDNKYLFVSLYRDEEKRSHGHQRYIHRLVAEAFFGEIQSGFVVNHKDKDVTNNKLENLEILSNRENCLHSVRMRKKSSKYPGVHYENATGYWKAMARIDGKKKYLGKFDNEESAYRAYQKFILENFGELKYA